MSDKKRKFRDHLNIDDYWLGLAFCLGAISNRKGTIIVDNLGNFISQGIEAQPNGIYGDSDHTLNSEIHAIYNSKNNCKNATIYLTHTPDYWSILQIVNAEIKRIVYFNTKSLCTDSISILKQGNVSAQPFNGNLNWLKDYIGILDELGIFSQNHK